MTAGVSAIRKIRIATENNTLKCFLIKAERARKKIGEGSFLKVLLCRKSVV